MGCASINEVTCCAPEPPAIAYTTFYDIPDSTTLFVPTEKVSLYKATPEWNQFKISGTENCGYVSIDEHLSDNISIFPNPFDDQITITLPGNTEGYFQLFNLKGMPIMSNSIDGYSQILLKTLSPGIYFYRIRNNQNVVSGKLIKN